MSQLSGRNRGIQGHQNSCYLDATLFAMFSFTGVFDGLLYRPQGPNSIEKLYLEFRLEKPLEFWLEIPYTKKKLKNW